MMKKTVKEQKDQPKRPFSASKMIPKDQPITTKKNIIPKSVNQVQAQMNKNIKQGTTLKEDEKYEDDYQEQEVSQEQKEIIRLKEQQQKEKQKFQQQIQQLQNDLEQQRNQIKELTEENNSQQKKNLEDKMDLKKLKQQITTLQIEKQRLESDLEEKNEIIRQSLEKLKGETNEDFRLKRDYLINSQMIKQKRYIQHLTKMCKNYRNISTEFEYQVGNIMSYLSEDLLKDEQIWGSKGKLTFQKAKDLGSKLGTLKQKFSDQIRITQIQFSQNLLKEYDFNSGKEMSKNQLCLSLENRANKLFNLLIQKNIKDPSIIGNLKEFLNFCFMYGLNLRLEENEYEINFTSKEIQNEVLRNFDQKLKPYETLALNVQQNMHIINYNQILTTQFQGLISKYQNKNLFQSVLDSFQNQTGNSNNNQLINLNSSTNESFISSTPNKKQIKSNKNDNIMQKINFANEIDLLLLNKNNNLIYCMLVATQIQLKELNEFAKKTFSKIEKTIKENVFQPFNDIFEIYLKFYKNDNSPQYPMHLSNTFNLHCETIYSNLIQIIKVSQEDIFIQIDNQDIPLINECFKQYQQQFNSLQQKAQEFLNK